jgi:hypothetical protein
MKKLLCTLIALSAALVWCGVSSAQGPGSGTGDPGTLSAAEQATLIHMREEEKLARDVYAEMYDIWAYKVFLNISGSEQNHMDAMLKMLDKYEVQDPVGDNQPGEFTDPDFAVLYDALVNRGGTSLLEAFMVGGYIEEMDIIDLEAALLETDNTSLTKSYSNLLAASRNHLRTFVSHVRNLGEDYEAQLMSQEDVDGIVGDYDIVPPSGFAMNAGMSDAWYFPGTAGQGFFLTVFEQQQKVFMGWFTYDTEPPGEACQARLGDPAHRWITAQGAFAGGQAELEVDMAYGGIFDVGDPTPVHEASGSILLQFEDCMNGSLYYDIPSIGRSGLVPIRRLANDHVALCEQLRAGSPTD